MTTRPSDQTIADVAMIARNGIYRIRELERERNKLRDLCAEEYTITLSEADAREAAEVRDYGSHVLITSK